MNLLLKAACLGTYLVAATGGLMALPWSVVSVLQAAALVLLGLHALELLVAFKNVRRHPGPLIDSVALTLLFGLLHWLPLARAYSQPKAANP